MRSITTISLLIGVLVLMLYIAAVGCLSTAPSTTTTTTTTMASPTLTPTPTPTPIPGILTITPDVSALKMGDRQVFQAVLSTQPTVGVAAAWSTDNDNVFSVSSDGVVVARLNGSATLIAAASGQSASRRLRVMVSVEGAWKGETVVQDCEYVSGVGSSPCRFTGGNRGSIDLTLSQSGDQLKGTLLRSSTFQGPVSGVMSDDRTFSLNGTAVDPANALTATISDWSASKSADLTALDGKFSETDQYITIFGPQVVKWVFTFHVTKIGP